jgi:hypothetical protein
MAETLNEFVASLMRISGGDIATLSRTTQDFAANITHDVRLPTEPATIASVSSHLPTANSPERVDGTKW